MTPMDLLKQYEAALASQDWQKVVPLMHSDICVTFSNGTFKGIDQVAAVFERNFALIKDEEYGISNIHWAYRTESQAVCLYTFYWRGIINEDVCSGGGRGTSVLIKADGKWQIITEHLGPLSDE